MKIVITIAVAIILGLAIGSGTAAIRARNVPPPAGAKVAVDADGFDFGTMDVSQDGSHEFKFTNKGNAPLMLTRGATSCSCTLGEITEPVLAPDQSTTVRVTWKSKQHKYVGKFKQNVTINTNDPDHPNVQLSITGEYTQPLRVEPDELNFDQIVGNKPATREARILSKLPNQPLKIVGHEFSDPAIAKYFDVEIRPLTPAEAEKAAGSASGVLATVTAKPGLPPGRFQQTITLRTNLPSASEIELHVFGSMGKEVSVVGNGWDDDIGVLNLGAVKPGTAVERQLVLIARGADAKDVRYNVVHVEPDYLKVSLGDAVLSEGDKLSRTNITIQIPARSAAANFMGGDQGRLGEIHIDTTSSHVHQVRIRIRFAIEGTDSKR